MTDLPQHIRDWIRMETELKTMVAFTRKLIDEVENKKIQYEFQRVLHNFIQRIHLNMVTISNSWREYLNNSKFKYPFYLLLRSLISDYIIMLYLIDGLRKDRRIKLNEAGFKERYIEISNSYFSKIQRELQNLVAERKITPRRMEKILSREKEFYPEHFEQGRKVIVKRMDDLPVGAIVKRLKKSKIKKFTGIYGQYIYFSQYAHFTVKTEDLNHNDRDEEFENFTITIDFLLLGLYMIIATIGYSKDRIAEFDKIHQEFKKKFSQ